EDCSYMIMVKTGTVDGAGSNFKISCTMKDAQGTQAVISNLEQYKKLGSWKS
ncbi:hypothetical protein FRX31_018987, partial [Thalictrum thalictroides]